MQYNLSVNTVQARLIEKALDLYIRMRIGQWQTLEELCLGFGLDAEEYLDRKDKIHEALAKARAVCYPDIGDSLNCSYGVGKFDDTQIVHDILQVLRHRVSWTEHPEGGSSLDFAPVTRFSDLPLPVCTADETVSKSKSTRKTTRKPKK